MIDEMGTDVQMMESAGGAKRHLQLVKASDETRYRTRLEGVRRAHPGVRLSMEDPCNGIETAEATAWLLVYDIVFETDAEDRRKNIAKLRAPKAPRVQRRARSAKKGTRVRSGERKVEP